MFQRPQILTFNAQVLAMTSHLVKTDALSVTSVRNKIKTLFNSFEDKLFKLELTLGIFDAKYFGYSFISVLKICPLKELLNGNFGMFSSKKS
jgi:hypothetical protein